MIALIRDLNTRGLLDASLVLPGSVFERTPVAQGDGRTHHPYDFTLWLAGGGSKGWYVLRHYRGTGLFCHREQGQQVRFHVTIFHWLGFDHEQLTYHHAGRDFRLTDVHGTVVDELTAWPMASALNRAVIFQGHAATLDGQGFLGLEARQAF